MYYLFMTTYLVFTYLQQNDTIERYPEIANLSKRDSISRGSISCALSCHLDVNKQSSKFEILS